jgi:anti-anti-sigma factor
MYTTLSPVAALTQLHIDTSWPSPGIALVVVAGEIDLATAHLLRERLLGVLHEQSPAVVDVDLVGVTFLDCTGIGALVSARNAAIQAGGQLRVTNAHPIVWRVLELTGLAGVLTRPGWLPPDTGPPKVVDLIT